ncbi:CBS domain-containing protein, partial [bacterium]|nr:CBS domain-containing protein [bacterium]
IYTIKLSRRGVKLRQGLEINVLRQLQVRDVVHHRLETCRRGTTLEELERCMAESPHYEFVVTEDDGALVGAISMDDMRHILPMRDALRDVVVAEDLVTAPVIFLREDDTLDRAMQQFGRRTYEELPVLPAGDSMVPIGVIRRQDVINAYNKAMLQTDLAGEMSDRVARVAQTRTWETVGDHVIAHVEAPPHFAGRTVADLRLRQTHRLQIILVQRGGTGAEPERIIPDGQTVLAAGDELLVFGQRPDVNRFAHGQG